MLNVFCSVIKKMENRPFHILMTPGEGIGYPLQYSALENGLYSPWGWRNINNLRYADDTTLMSESEEELESHKRRKWKKTSLKLNIQKTKIMASGPITSYKQNGKKWKL